MIKSYGLLIILFIVSSISSFTTQADANQVSENKANIRTAPQTILILGDSLSAAYGIPIEQSWVTLLAQIIEKQFYNTNTNYQVHNASISGETTDGGLRSLPALLKKYQPKVVIIELGANDGLRGFPLKTIEQNLATLIELAQAQNSKVLLTGIHIPPNYGQRYATAFHNTYGRLAERYHTALVPFLLEGIATQPSLMQADRLHPKAEAQESIKNLVWRQLAPLL
ncbi:MAG: acyl-CoA thioesterase-1 [Pseudohongiellaceae bacterium]|jgi:acyl-CoA thioesterase-1